MTHPSATYSKKLETELRHLKLITMQKHRLTLKLKNHPTYNLDQSLQNVTELKSRPKFDTPTCHSLDSGSGDIFVFFCRYIFGLHRYLQMLVSTQKYSLASIGRFKYQIKKRVPSLANKKILFHWTTYDIPVQDSSALGIHTALQLATAPRSSTSLQEIPLPTALLQEYPGQHGRKNLLQIQLQIWQIWQIPRLQSLGSISFPRCLRSSTDAPPIWTVLKINVDLPCSKRHYVSIYIYTDIT